MKVQTTTQKKPIRLTYMLVQEVSPVDQAANNRKFLRIKNLEGATAMKTMLSPEVKKALGEVCKNAQGYLTDIQKMIDSAEESPEAGSEVPEELGMKLQDLCKLVNSVSVGEQKAEPPKEEKPTEAPCPPMTDEEKAALDAMKEVEGEDKASKPMPEKYDKEAEDKAAKVPPQKYDKEAEDKAATSKPTPEKYDKAAPSEKSFVTLEEMKSVMGDTIKEALKSIAPIKEMTPPQGKRDIPPPAPPMSEDDVWTNFDPNSKESRSTFKKR